MPTNALKHIFISITALLLASWASYSSAADTIPPSIKIAGPKSGSNVSSPVYISTIATDDIGVSRVDFYQNGNLIGSDQTSPFATILESSMGMYTLTAVAYDAAGNSTTSDPVNISIINSPLIIKGAVALDPTTVDVRFNGLLDPTTVDISYFSASGGLMIFTTILQPDQQTVRLMTSPQSTQISYAITASNSAPTIKDTSGNQLGYPNTAYFIGYNSAATGAKDTISGSKHDLAHLNQRAGFGDLTYPMQGFAYNDYKDTCVYCHVPHTGGASFNRTLPQDNYKIYTGSMESTPNRPGGISLVCLSCHDGTIAVDSIVKMPSGNWDPAYSHMKMNSGTTGSSCGACHQAGGVGGAHDGTVKYLTQDLRDDHPISMSYLEAKAAKPYAFQDPFFLSPMKLFNNRVECPTCHDVHNPSFEPFLRKPNIQSSLCTTCHIR